MRRLTVSTMDPHTTRPKGRPCTDCHGSPKAVGLGTGALSWKGGALSFVPALSAAPELLGLDHPLDAFVDPSGRVLVHTSRPGLRPLRRDEIKRILEVGLCLECHSRDDPIFKAWPKRPCRAFERAFPPL